MKKLRRFCFRETAERGGKVLIVKTEKILGEKSCIMSWESKREREMRELRTKNWGFSVYNKLQNELEKFKFTSREM